MNPIATAILHVSVMIFILVCIYFAIRDAQKDSYKDGQADAIKGMIKVKLVEFEDGHRAWYYEKDLKHLKKHTIIS